MICRRIPSPIPTPCGRAKVERSRKSRLLRSSPQAALHVWSRAHSASITPCSREQVARCFGGPDLVPPGLFPISQWGLAGQIDTTVGSLVGYCAMAQKL
jgi:hypothetical protein